MTDEDLARIEARMNAATAAPWTISRFDTDSPEEFSGIVGPRHEDICTTDRNCYGPSLPDAEFAAESTR
jgi:hypothetical protein